MRGCFSTALQPSVPTSASTKATIATYTTKAPSTSQL
jgi:hypothetical protein